MRGCDTMNLEQKCDDQSFKVVSISNPLTRSLQNFSLCFRIVKVENVLLKLEVHNPSSLFFCPLCMCLLAELNTIDYIGSFVIEFSLKLSLPNAIIINYSTYNIRFSRKVFFERPILFIFDKTCS